MASTMSNFDKRVEKMRLWWEERKRRARARFIYAVPRARSFARSHMCIFEILSTVYRKVVHRMSTKDFRKHIPHSFLAPNTTSMSATQPSSNTPISHTQLELTDRFEKCEHPTSPSHSSPQRPPPSPPQT